MAAEKNDTSPCEETLDGVDDKIEDNDTAADYTAEETNAKEVKPA